MDRKYLKKRRAGWYVQVRVPPSLKDELGGSIVRSLHTRDIVEARSKRWAKVAEIKAYINLVSTSRAKEPTLAARIISQGKRFAVDLREGGENSEAISEVGLESIIAKYLKGHPIDSETGHPAVPPEVEEALQTAATLINKPDARLLSEVVETYLSEVKERVTNQTYNAKRRRLESLVKYLGDREISAVTRSDAGSYLTDILIPLRQAVKTTKAVVSDCSALFSWAVERGMIDTNPFQGKSKSIRKPVRGGPRSRRAWTEDELTTLFTALPEDSDLYHLAAIGLYAGMRLNEIAETKVADVKPGYIHIPAGKTDAAVRDVPLHAVIKPLVERLAGESTDGYLIPNLRRGGEDKKRGHYASKRFGKRIRRIGITDPAVVFHSLRNSFTNSLERAGVPLSTAKLITGHERRDLTFGGYSQGLPFDHLQKAVASLSHGSIDSLIRQR